ncbi:MAG TPA: YIP1 family protein [Myxococcales bacterium]|nr:YIP1 family protein [Myxococcales bacterium]
MLARCPSCRNTFSTERSGTQECPVCGKPLLVPEPAAAAAAPELADSAAGTPWERRAQLGFFTAWGQTLQQALFEPSRLFASARLDRGAAQLGFAVLTASVFSAVGQVFGRLVRARMQAYYDQLAAFLNLPLEAVKLADSPAVFVSFLLFLPALVLIFVYANAAVTHFFALILRQARRGFPATFAACAYASAPLVLLAIPGCGSIVGTLWLVVLTGVGLKQTHRISPGGAAGVTIAPYLLICCLGLVASLATALRMGQAMGTP